MNIVQGLNVNVGIKPQRGPQQVVASQNSDVQFLLSFFDELGNPLSVTAATAIALKILEADGVTVLTKSLSGGIALVSGINNQALVTMLAADLALLPDGESDIQIQLSLAGINYAFNFFSSMKVQLSVV